MRVEKTEPERALTNAEIAGLLLNLANLLSARRENPYKVKAYRRAANSIANMGQSVDEIVRTGGDVTMIPGIGEAIRSAIHEIVVTGTLRRLEALRTTTSPEIVSISDYPLLDPRRVLRIYKKLGISSIDELKQSLVRGEIAEKLGVRMDQHVRRALAETREMLWYEAEKVVENVGHYLLTHCGTEQAEPVGEFRRRLEVVREIAFLVETKDFGNLIEKLQRYGGKADVIDSAPQQATLKLSSGILLTVFHGTHRQWGIRMIECTGSHKHVERLASHYGFLELKDSTKAFPTEESVYREIGLSFIPPELREGNDEVVLAANNNLPQLVCLEDIRGELHAHTVSSDGANSIEEMVAAAGQRGLRYLGISDHSQSLKIAHGVPEPDLWKQIRYIDKLNERSDGIRILKGAEVDILQDGALDYSAAVLRELDYTICSIHSRFGMNRREQTERILRAMDNKYFNILGHATGRLLLKRPGYEIDLDRIIEHASSNNCHFELNSSPDRLDVSATNARLIGSAGVGIVITTDAHSTREFGYLRLGIDQARRAGLPKEKILNHLDWPEFKRALRR
jgi:DNA polymerase (family 10)